MTNHEKAIQAVMDAIDELNEQLPKEERLEKSVDTLLFGSGGSLDSLGLVSLVTTIEQNIEEKFGISITLLDDIAELENDNPLSTVSSLTDYVASILEKNTVE